MWTSVTGSEPVPRGLINAVFCASLAALLGACTLPGAGSGLQLRPEADAPAPDPVPDPAPGPVLDLAPGPVTTSPWIMATASVSDIGRTAQFFQEIGGYERVAGCRLQDGELSAHGLPPGAAGEALILRAPGSVGGLVRLVRFEDAGARVPMRPGSRAWDTGCYWSLMVRAQGLDAIYTDAIDLGWWTHTPVTDLDFGGSVLKVVVFQGPDGLQVQAYERISPPLEGFTPFQRLSQPFNIMQMSADREAARRLMEDVLGFSRFWFGPPYVEQQPTDMPLGIPRDLTTEIPYKAGIFHPVPGEYGRMEYIEIDGLEGKDFSERCHAPNLGWLSVTYEVGNAEAARGLIVSRGGEIVIDLFTEDRIGVGEVRAFAIRSPDGALIEFVERL